MPSVRIEIVFNHFPQAIEATLAGTDELSTGVAHAMYNGAVQAAPVRTGALRRGINLVEGNPAEVTASSLAGGGLREYAAYNEFGTRYMSANPFMMPGYVAGLAHVPIEGRKYGAKIEAAV